jgi:hypothetical protein
MRFAIVRSTVSPDVTALCSPVTVSVPAQPGAASGIVRVPLSELTGTAVSIENGATAALARGAGAVVAGLPPLHAANATSNIRAHESPKPLNKVAVPRYSTGDA